VLLGLSPLFLIRYFKQSSNLYWHVSQYLAHKDGYIWAVNRTTTVWWIILCCFCGRNEFVCFVLFQCYLGMAAGETDRTQREGQKTQSQERGQHGQGKRTQERLTQLANHVFRYNMSFRAPVLCQMHFSSTTNHVVTCVDLLWRGSKYV
jgi:hypothetical protein